MQDREKIFRAFLVKSVYDFPTTKLLIENLRMNPSLRRLCGWEYRGAVPSEATFSRAFSEFAAEQIFEEVHLHTELDLSGNLSCFLLMSNGKMSDIRAAKDNITILPDSIGSRIKNLAYCEMKSFGTPAISR